MPELLPRKDVKREPSSRSLAKPMIRNLLAKLKQDGILEVISKGGGRRAQVLALAELVNLSEVGG